jgi:hypothetical protein
VFIGVAGASSVGNPLFGSGQESSADLTGIALSFQLPELKHIEISDTDR